MLQACLNGNRQRDAHPALPVTPQALAADAAAVAELGVTALHVHPRDTAGAEVLAGPEVATAVSVVRAAVPGVEISVTTGAWIQPDPVRRAELVAGWAALAAGRPDTASVNVHEDGWQHTCAALHSAGIGIELGVFHVPAAQTLRANGVPPGSVRVLAEVQPGESPAALLAALSWSDLPILLHGQDDDAWPVFAEAARLGLSTRMGLEDALHRPDGTPTLGNADLITAARAMLGT
ncbi:3-keto-5-aminohexanoate cleavage protein [Kutzneria sp. 744]|uniref:3-keto-5-aminohexanoate cleavage protein n=1 Tax=Kutzneria sp. (strain 744) TaxID=345341 RepID=UPI0003EEB921|nr:3-keto-5-aminohexanoate cleavage protein [Kutzneria sp. 744]EWM16269.1 vegetative cell wall protein gp1 [Kutzneria sp. 744]